MDRLVYFRFFFVWMLLAFFYWPVTVQSMVTGQVCAHCHVMHAQEAGIPTADSPGVNLLISSCLGCHTGVNGTDNTPQVGDTPYVLQGSEPNYGTGAGLGTGTEGSSQTLAAGNFYWVNTGSKDATGHNLTGADAVHGNIPPGGSALSSQLTCAGSLGCHGDRSKSNEYTAMRGTHHELSGVSSATSYRFLDGIGGTEDSDWEWRPTSSAHNIYLGEERNSDSVTSPTTISGFCAICHSKFHHGASPDGISDSSFATPWIRHPIDISMPVSGDYVSYSSYSVVAPVATSSIDGSYNPGSTPGDRIIMCLTCHRAHGTPYDAILRWNYKAWPGAAGYDGCGICHSSKK